MKTRIISITIILTLIFTIINTGQDIYAANKKFMSLLKLIV